jgi:hypothetical protein
MTVLEAIRVLGITSETLFQRVKDCVERGNDDMAREHLKAFDAIVKELEELHKKVAK